MSKKTLADWYKSEANTIDEYLKVGDVVDVEMYNYFLDILPPRTNYTNYLQVGEPCNHLPNKEGKFMPTYLTFSKDETDNWKFNGECFVGEKINRNYLLVDIDKSVLQNDETFRYQLLGRMQTDCNYFLGNGNRLDKFLWAGSVEEQIAYMKALYNSFPDDKKPEWISLEDINNYENEMTNDEVNINNDKDEPDICD
jgi:hypothetical protein